MLINIHTHNSGDVYSMQSIDLAAPYELTGFFSCGVHPWNADTLIDFEQAAALIQDPRCVAIGEVGIDKLKGPDVALQIEMFERWVALSEQFELPLIIHCVRSWKEILRIKSNFSCKQPWIFHGFVKSNLLEEVLRAGVYVSFGQRLLSDTSLQDLVKELPLDRFYLETDAANISIHELYEKVSELKNIPLPQLEGKLEESVKRTFKKWIIGSKELNC